MTLMIYCEICPLNLVNLNWTEIHCEVSLTANKKSRRISWLWLCVRWFFDWLNCFIVMFRQNRWTYCVYWLVFLVIHTNIRINHRLGSKMTLFAYPNPPSVNHRIYNCFTLFIISNANNNADNQNTYEHVQKIPEPNREL